MTPRTLKRLHPAQRDDIGDLVTRRPLPGPAIAQLDPFLFLNHHGPQVYPPNNRGLPFGPHPHRGFETVTFILDGELSHLDSGGHESVIGPGGVQWMTAGRGLVHAELSPASFKQAGGPLEILQLWVNLPGRLKMTTPNYLGLQGAAIPKVEIGGASIEVVSGEVAGVAGPFPSLIGIEMSVVRLAPGGALNLPVAPGRAVFLYVVSGEVLVGGQAAPQMAPKWNLVELNDDGDAVAFDSPSGAVALLGHAEPIGEPVFAHGPFVMNTREEIVQAIDDYNAGKFGAVPG
jgi:redox-sensitive bicupin YhaK (pirin superfamily)